MRMDAELLACGPPAEAGQLGTQRKFTTGGQVVRHMDVDGIRFFLEDEPDLCKELIQKYEAALTVKKKGQNGQQEALRHLPHPGVVRTHEQATHYGHSNGADNSSAYGTKRRRRLAACPGQKLA